MQARWLAKRAASSPEAYRTLETAHFRLNYSLRGLNRIKTTDADSGLLRLIDSLYRISPGGGSGLNDDASVDARLDSLHAPHPIYAVIMSGFFEQARAYYVDKLGMRAPRSVGFSYYYQAPAATDGKYSVDVVDVGTAEPDFRGQEVYALTFPAAEGGMLMENDFLYNTHSLTGDGIPQGDTIGSTYMGKLIHNYGIDWQAGLKVTCFHEFYHAVQFTYTPNPNDFHVWYETGAVGMEERNAPEVNDYLQYLPAYFEDLPSVSMFNYPGRLSWYGNGIFHLFLARELGEAFDVGVWSRFAANGNNIKDALPAVGLSQGKSLRQVYAEFAAQLAFSGETTHPPFAPFSPDMPLWPSLQSQSLDLKTITSYQTTLQTPLTITAWKITGAAGSGKSLALQDTGMAPVLAQSSPDSSIENDPQGLTIGLGFANVPGRENVLLLANSSTDRTSGALILTLQSLTAATLFAYPNPMKRVSATDRLYFSRLNQASTIQIFSEAGRAVRSLAFTPDSLLWSWDLNDDRGQPMESGLYYYRGAGPLAAFVVY